MLSIIIGINNYIISVMMNPDTIKELIAAGLPDADIIVEGDDGTHFQARIISGLFADKTMVQQHQMVYKTLGDKMGTDIHALSIQTYTPDEWEQQ
jgi:acid stress-induced BolA-like protein IbaG/YrbA